MSTARSKSSSRLRTPLPLIQATATPITSAADGLAHDVEDAEVLAGRTVGRYVAVCGASVVPAALTAEEGRFCRSCAEIRRLDLTEIAGERPARAARRAQSRWLMACIAMLRGTLCRRAVVWS